MSEMSSQLFIFYPHNIPPLVTCYNTFISFIFYHLLYQKQYCISRRPGTLWYLDGAQAFSSLDIHLLGLVIQLVIFVWDYLWV